MGCAFTAHFVFRYYPDGGKSILDKHMFSAVLNNQGSSREHRESTVESTIRPVRPIREIRQKNDTQDVEGGHAEFELSVHCSQPQARISGIGLLGNRSGLRSLVSDCGEQVLCAVVEIASCYQSTNNFILPRWADHTLFPVPPRFGIGLLNESDTLCTLFDTCVR